MNRRMSTGELLFAGSGALLGVLLLVVLAFISVLERPVDSDGVDLFPAIHDTTSDEAVPPAAYGMVAGPCSVLGDGTSGIIEDGEGNWVVDVTLYPPADEPVLSGSCAVLFDTAGVETPRLPLYVIVVDDLYAEMPLSKDQPVGYLGKFVLKPRTTG